MALVGGDEADLERATPVLDVLTRKIVHVGPVGQGSLMKLVINLPLAASRMAFKCSVPKLYSESCAQWTSTCTVRFSFKVTISSASATNCSLSASGSTLACIAR